MSESPTLETFLDQAAAHRPDPGGGAVAALAGALAAAMGAMAMRFSLREKDLDHHEPHEVAIDKLDKLRTSLAGSIDADQKAFANLIEAKRAGVDVEGAARDAVAVPLSIINDAAAVLETAGGVAGTCNQWLLSDLGVCCDLAMATIRSATWSVHVNLPDLVKEDRAAILARCEKLHHEAITRVIKTTATIRDRMKA